MSYFNKTIQSLVFEIICFNMVKSLGNGKFSSEHMKYKHNPIRINTSQCLLY
jgi:hypothetical protein